jgi:hypothetical protein
MATPEENAENSRRLLWLLPRLKAAHWISGDILITPGSSEVNLTPLGKRRLKWLFGAQKSLYPEFFDRPLDGNTGQERAAAQAIWDAIFKELDEANPGEDAFKSAAAKEFLCAYVRTSAKSLPLDEP